MNCALGRSGMLVDTLRILLCSERALNPHDGDRTTAKSLSDENCYSHTYFCFLPPILSWQRELDNLVVFWLGMLNGLDPPELPKGFAPRLQSWLFYFFFFPALLQLALCPSKSGVGDGFFLCCTVIKLNVVSLGAFMVLGDAVYLTPLNFISG